MAWYLVERTAWVPLALPGNGPEAPERQQFLENDRHEGVSWLHSYVTLDGTRSCCLCEAPGPAAIRRAAERNGLPIDRISEIRLLQP